MERDSVKLQAARDKAKDLAQLASILGTPEAYVDAGNAARMVEQLEAGTMKGTRTMATNPRFTFTDCEGDAVTVLGFTADADDCLDPWLDPCESCSGSTDGDCRYCNHGLAMFAYVADGSLAAVAVPKETASEIMERN